MITKKSKFYCPLPLSIWLVMSALIILPLLCSEAQAAESGKYLTKGEAVSLLAASDFLKNKIGALLSWTIGYDVSSVNRAKVVPVINYILAVPRKAPPDGRTIVELQASIDDPGGLINIQGVRADLSEIGKLSNMMLVDNGLWGDIKAGDGIYTIQTNVSPKVSMGEKEVAIAVANNKGWVTMAKTSLLVLNPPKIISAEADPFAVIADGQHTVLLKVTIADPQGKFEIKRVFANLQSIKGETVSLLRDDGNQDDERSGDNVYTAKIMIPRGIAVKSIEIPVYAEAYSGAADFTRIKMMILQK